IIPRGQQAADCPRQAADPLFPDIHNVLIPHLYGYQRNRQLPDIFPINVLGLFEYLVHVSWSDLPSPVKDGRGILDYQPVLCNLLYDIYVQEPSKNLKRANQVGNTAQSFER